MVDDDADRICSKMLYDKGERKTTNDYTVYMFCSSIVTSNLWNIFTECFRAQNCGKFAELKKKSVFNS